MSITVIVELQVRQDRLQDVLPLFSALLPETRGREGNEGVSVHLDLDRPTSVVLVERWAGREQYAAYNRWRAERGDLAKLAELLEAAPQRRFLSHMLV